MSKLYFEVEYKSGRTERLPTLGVKTKAYAKLYGDLETARHLGAVVSFTLMEDKGVGK